MALAALALPVEVGAAQLALSWTDNASDEAGFTVERREISTAVFQVVATLPVDSAAYLDAAVLAGVSYCYRVRAFNAEGPSAYTNEACGTATTTQPLSVRLNQSTFRPSDTLIATVDFAGGIVTAPIDAYIVLQVGGALLSLQADGRFVVGLVPIARRLVLPTLSVPLTFPLTGATPGTYTWIAAVTSPGTLSVMAPLATTLFTIVP